MKKKVAFMLCAALILSLCIFGTDARALAIDTNVWSKEYYKDVFGDPTEEFYFINSVRFSGSFNSETEDDALLKAEIIVDEQSLFFVLYENGSDKVKNRFESELRYEIAVKAADGSKFPAEGTMPRGDSRIEIAEEDREQVLSALCAEEGQVSFYLQREDQPMTNYLFTAQCGNLADLFKEEQYQTALALLEEQPIEALEAFLALGEFKDSKTQAEKLSRNLGGFAWIGYSYLVGDGVEQDYGKALEWFERAAELGDAWAMNNIGLMYHYGDGVEQD